MKIDLSDLKVGDRVFHSSFGELRVTKEYPGTHKIEINRTDYNKNGKDYFVDAHPKVFHGENECAEYFKWVAEQNKPKKKYYLHLPFTDFYSEDGMQLPDPVEGFSGRCIKKIKIENVFIER